MMKTALGISTAQQMAGISLVSFASWMSGVESMLTTAGLEPWTLYLATVGVAAGLLHNPPQQKRLRLFSLALVFSVVSAALATVAVEISFLAWLKPVRGPFALLLGYYAQVVLPGLPALIRERFLKSGDSP